MSKRVAIVQSNYIPWKGYFDLIAAVDEFVLYDDVQYTRRDWRNRNLIKMPGGPHWLTIPVEVKGRYSQLICEARVSDNRWASRHLETLRHAYATAPCFQQYWDMLAETYATAGTLSYLSDINRLFLERLCRALNIQTRMTASSDYPSPGVKSEKLLSICLQAGATTYLSGPAARCYLDEGLFERAGIAVEWMNYDGYPAYEQLYPPFAHGVSVLDLLLTVGEEAPRFMLRGQGCQLRS
jgi:hypothetical protein